MPSEADEQLESIRRLLLSVVLLLGVGVAALGDIAVAVRGYETLIPTVARATGIVSVIVVIVQIFSG
ncbi:MULTISPECIES: hypothetical protein [unclassified Halorubrum]|jgi:hypothetical protein|uniref:hypothetical protein n=1 Tax=unclassified Halorubrum TaxID=2642239 RepID=UPI000EF1B412|nr:MULTISPECIES: hypothetical protein [unclassified Halorubrum]RLM51497.1 hypothetical protein DVK06_03625 [Halorubrum sp. Atlit-28R]TKX46093.1 hypothetical protein EXE50_02525 [Halorubrum sp. ARQ200]TKX50066.1 hypothetical protein EXE49_07800 [Halorubrum sp. ASP121]